MRVERGELGEEGDGDLHGGSFRGEDRASWDGWIRRRSRSAGGSGRVTRRGGGGRCGASSRRCRTRSGGRSRRRCRSVSSSWRRAASTRMRSTYWPGASPTSSVNTRVKWRGLIAARRASSAMRWSAAGSASIASWTLRTDGRSARRHPHRRGELRLTAGAAEEHHEPAGDGLGDLGAVVLLDHREGQVDAGGDARPTSTRRPSRT